VCQWMDKMEGWGKFDKYCIMMDGWKIRFKDGWEKLDRQTDR